MKKIFYLLIKFQIFGLKKNIQQIKLLIMFFSTNKAYFYLISTDTIFFGFQYPKILVIFFNEGSTFFLKIASLFLMAQSGSFNPFPVRTQTILDSTKMVFYY